MEEHAASSRSSPNWLYEEEDTQYNNTFQTLSSCLCFDEKENRKLLFDDLRLENVSKENLRELKLFNASYLPIMYDDRYYALLLDTEKDLFWVRLAFFGSVLVGAICCKIDVLEDEKEQMSSENNERKCNQRLEEISAKFETNCTSSEFHQTTVVQRRTRIDQFFKPLRSKQNVDNLETNLDTACVLLEKNSSEMSASLAKIDHNSAKVKHALSDENKLEKNAVFGIHTLACHPAFRRRGVASRLLCEALAFCRAQNANDEQNEERILRIQKVFLYVQPVNSDALALYKKFGFKLVEHIADYYRRLKPSAAFRMEFSFV